MDKRLLTAAILLPVTIFLLGAALFSGRTAGTAGGGPVVPPLWGGADGGSGIVGEV